MAGKKRVRSVSPASAQLDDQNKRPATAFTNEAGEETVTPSGTAAGMLNNTRYSNFSIHDAALVLYNAANDVSTDSDTELSDAPSGTQSAHGVSAHLATNDKATKQAVASSSANPIPNSKNGEQSAARVAVAGADTERSAGPLMPDDEEEDPDASSSASSRGPSSAPSGLPRGIEGVDRIPPVLLEKIKKKAANSNISIEQIDLEGEDWFPEIPVIPNAPHKLIPVEPRQKAIQGRKDTSLLTILVKNSQDGKLQELRYAKTPWFMIDWNSKGHIADINNWRTQIWGRAGFKEKQIIKFTEEEDDWFDLYYNLGLAKGLQAPTKLPGAMTVMEDFNKFFQGKILTDKKGQALEPREARSYSSFASKATRIFTAIKEANPGVFDETERQFRPVITEALLRSYQGQKKNVDIKDDAAVKAMFAALLLEHDKSRAEQTTGEPADN